MSKKSFILFKDSLDILDDLDDALVAALFRAIKDYQNGVNVEQIPMVKMVFLPFKNQFIRDDEKYDEFREEQRQKGLKSAESRKYKNQPKSTAVNHSQPLPTDSTYTVTDTVTDNATYTFERFWELYGKKNGKKAAEINWNKLSAKDKTDAVEKMNNHKKSSERRFWKDPERYLKDRRWEDEASNSSTSSRQPILNENDQY